MTLMGKVLAVRCPVCGMVKNIKEGDDPFDPDPNNEFIAVQEVGGKQKTGRGVGRGGAKGKVETKDTHDFGNLPRKYNPLASSLENRTGYVYRKLNNNKNPW